MIEPLNDAEAILCQEAASPIAYRLSGGIFSGYVDFLDVRSVLVLWCLERPEQIREWLENEGQGAMALSLKREGRRWCEKEKATISGYEADDQARYSWAQIQEILPLALSGEHRLLQGSAPDSDAHRNKRLANEGSTIVAVYTDVLGAWQRLPLEDQRVVWDCMELGVPKAALLYEIPESTMRSRMQSKFKKMARMLNGD